MPIPRPHTRRRCSNPGTADIWLLTLCWGGCSVPRGLFSGIPGLQPPMPDPFISAVSTEAVSRYCPVSPGGQNRPPDEHRCPRPFKSETCRRRLRNLHSEQAVLTPTSDSPALSSLRTAKEAFVLLEADAPSRVTIKPTRAWM